MARDPGCREDGIRLESIDECSYEVTYNEEPEATAFKFTSVITIRNMFIGMLKKEKDEVVFSVSGFTIDADPTKIAEFEILTFWGDEYDIDKYTGFKVGYEAAEAGLDISTTSEMNGVLT